MKNLISKIFKKKNTINLNNSIEDLINNLNLDEKTKRWNKFISEICSKELNELSEIQKNAVLCFWYDAEMESGGHSGYFDCYSDVIPEDLINAIKIIGTKEIADNFLDALRNGETDDYEEVDMKYYNFSPDLAFYLEEYVENNNGEIFK